MTEFEIENQEITMLTELLAEQVAKEYKEFSKFLGYKTEMDFICHDMDTDKFLGLILKNSDYLCELRESTYKNIELLKHISKFYKIIGQVHQGNYVVIKIKTSNQNKEYYVRVNLYDIMWGLLMWKDKPLYEIIHEEILVAPLQ